MSEDNKPSGPDLTRGVALSELKDGKISGRVSDADVLLVKSGSEIFAIDAHCSHYHGPLADGVVDGDEVRCPWHHACFSLRTGEALHAPATFSLNVYTVEQKDGKVFVRSKREPEIRARKLPSSAPKNIVIVGGGAAGFAAAEMLRREGYGGAITMLSDDKDSPVDRPNLSKDYLAGSAPEDWMPLRGDEFYSENKIELKLGTDVTAIDAKAKTVTAGGGKISYDRLLLATGAEPVRLDFPGANQPNVHTLRTFADCRAIIAGLNGARRAVVIGASFIGLETAASLKTRGLEVHVVAPEKRPMERVLGPAMGDFIKGLHEEKGIVFHLEDTVAEIKGSRVTLKSGGTLEADLVIMGVGVRPRTKLAEAAGLALDKGVRVNEFLETSAPGIFAAGDIARWPDPHSRAAIRVEHWVVAERQGQVAARNMLGLAQKYTAVPFFWSQHYDVPINYVGHAESWDTIEVEGDIKGRDCLLRYKQKGRVLAVASIYRDVASLEAEIAMERAVV